jgi:hypothetical protein
MRPEIKKGDTVRLRTDGEIGETNKYEYKSSMNRDFTAEEIIAKNFIRAKRDDSWAIIIPSIRFDICNDFSNIQPGDEVEYVVHNEMVKAFVGHINKLGDIFVNGSHFDPNPSPADFRRLVRITKKAEPKPLLLAKSRQCGKTMQYGTPLDALNGNIDKERTPKKPILKDAKVGWKVYFSNNESRIIKEIVTHPNLPKKYVMNEAIVKQLPGVVYSGTSAFNEDGTAYTHFCGSSPGFDIYATYTYCPKPEPLLADAKVGDLCKLIDGSWKQIDELRHNANKSKILYVVDGYGYYENGKWTLNEIKSSILDILDIIEHQPLAKEGSADWAKQMMLLGYEVCHCTYTGIFRIVDGRIQQYISNRWDDFCDKESNYFTENFKRGWQIYKPEPKPEPKSKCHVCNGSGEIYMKPVSTTSNDYYRCYRCNGTGHEPKPKFEIGQFLAIGKVGFGRLLCTTKSMEQLFVRRTDGSEGWVTASACVPVPASEVVIDFGSGIKGHIRKHLTDSGLFSIDIATRSSIYVPLDVLSEPMKSTVLSLLERQEKESQNENI